MCWFQKHQIEGGGEMTAENNCSMIIHMGKYLLKNY